jgi:hypothetical protein
MGLVVDEALCYTRRMNSLWTRLTVIAIGIPVIGSLFAKDAQATVIQAPQGEHVQSATASEEHEAVYFVGCGGFL